MEIKKEKKYNRQGKIFSVLLKIFSIVLGLILVLILFGTITMAFFTYFGFGTVILTVLASVYIVPILGIIAIILALMYIVKIIQYKEKKGLIIFRSIFSAFLLIMMLIGAVFTFLEYGLNNTYIIKVDSKIVDIQDTEIKENLYNILENEDIYVKRIVLIANLGFRETVYYNDINGMPETYSSTMDDMKFGILRDKGTEITWLTQFVYSIFVILAIIALVILYDILSKQYKLLIQTAINKEEKNEVNSINLTEEQIIKSGKRKVIMVSSIIAIVIILFIVIAVIINYSKRKKEEEKTWPFQEQINYTENDNSEEEQSEEYQYFSDEKNGTLVKMQYPFRDKYIIQIYKTKDGGENWEEIDTNLTQVYVGTKCLFINENIGFLHDPHGGVDSYASLKITTDGGYTWENVTVNKPDQITENNIFYKDLPTVNGDKLEVIAYTVRLSRTPNEKYYIFESTDYGKTWDYVREVSYDEILNQD